jgi:hypothetical protein
MLIGWLVNIQWQLFYAYSGCRGVGAFGSKNLRKSGFFNTKTKNINQLFWLSCLGFLVYLFQKTLKLFGIPIF